jgi:ABC-2 type transport system ATP-binding protein
VPLGQVAVRGRVGYLPEHFRFHDWLTGRELLELHGRLYEMQPMRLAERIHSLLSRLDLLEHASRKLADYSKGLLQRIGLAQALLNTPELIFLDEPTSALDPLGRFLVRDLIREQRERGATVFLNSHLLGEVEATCDRVAFVREGRVVQEMTLAEQDRSLDLELRLEPVTPELLEGLARFGRQVRHENGSLVKLRVEGEAQIPALARWLVGRDVALYRLAARPHSLEELFVEVLGDR